MAEARVSQAGVIIELEQATPGIEVFQAGMLVEAGFEGVGVTKFGIIVEIGSDALHVTKFGLIIELELKDLPVPTNFERFNPGPQPHLILPEPLLGYQLDENGSFWTIVTPQASTNIAENGSFEGPLVESQTEEGTFLTSEFDYTLASRGFRSRNYVTQAPDLGRILQQFNITSATYVTFSFDLYMREDHTFTLYARGVTGDLLITSATIQATRGGWKRYTFTYYDTNSMVDGARVFVLATNAAQNAQFNTDGWQIEFSQHPTTYFDGDSQEFAYDADPYAYAWKSARYLSPSVRSARTYNGGQERSLEDYGFRTTSIVGLGMGETTLDVAILASGEEILKDAFIAGKEFSIIGKVFGVNAQEVQYNRQGLINLLNTLNSRAGMVMLGYQPVDRRGRPYGKKLWIYATFLGGMGMTYTNLYQETLELRFRVFNARLFEEFGSVKELDRGGEPEFDTTIYARNPNTGYIDPYLAGASSTLGGTVKCAVIMDDGSLLVGGSFTSIGGVAAKRCARFNPVTLAWEEFGGGFNEGEVNALAIGRGILDGLPIAVGSFLHKGDGVVDLDRAAYIDSTTDLWKRFGFGFDGTVRDVDVSPSGLVLVGGEFRNTAVGALPMYAVAYTDSRLGGTDAWQTVASSTDGDAFCVKIGPDDTFYFGGDFTELSGEGDANYIASWRVGDGFITPLVLGLEDDVWDIEFGPDGYLYAVGAFTDNFEDTITLRHFAKFSGNVWEEVGRGEVDSTFHYLAWDRRGYAYLVGTQTIDGDYPTEGNVGRTSLFQWTGSTWVSPDLRGIKISAPAMGKIAVASDGTLLLPTYGATNLMLSGHTEVNYQGTADATVKLKVMGPCVLHRFSNWTINKHIYFKSLYVMEGEVLYLDMTGLFPIAFTNHQADILSDILISVSDIDSFRLVPGINNITILMSGTFEDDTAAYLQWNEHHWSIDIASQ